VLPKSIYGKYAHGSPTAYFGHYHASMWHALDAEVVVLFWRLRCARTDSVYGWHFSRALVWTVCHPSLLPSLPLVWTVPSETNAFCPLLQTLFTLFGVCARHY
jgi:hypothetical protein